MKQEQIDHSKTLLEFCRHGHRLCTEMIMDCKGVDPNVTDEQGNTPIMIATLLTCNKVDITIANKKGETALDIAVRIKRHDLIDMLLADNRMQAFRT